MTDYTRDDGGSEGTTDGDDTVDGGDADVEAGEGSETGDDVPDGESGGDVDPDGADDGAPVACTSYLDCNDYVDCTSDVCDPGTGLCRNEPIDGVCDDGNACTSGEWCDPSSGCIVGTALSCDDGIDCTRDACDPFTGECSSPPNHGACPAPQLCDPDVGGCTDPPPRTTHADCDDGNLCNGIETCDPAVGCQAGRLVECNDGVACTVDICDPLTGACMATPDDDSCDNHNLCDGAETCNASTLRRQTTVAGLGPS